MTPPLPCDLPQPLMALADIAGDLRWTWSHEADALWQRIDADAWARLQNPWAILQNQSASRLEALAADPAFAAEFDRVTEARRAYLATPGWFTSTYGAKALGGVAYFSMEFGLGTALPLYAGGLGVLAGDYLKTASDLDVPWSASGCCSRKAISARRSTRPAGNMKPIPTTIPVHCRSGRRSAPTGPGCASGSISRGAS